MNIHRTIKDGRKQHWQVYILIDPVCSHWWPQQQRYLLYFLFAFFFVGFIFLSQAAWWCWSETKPFNEIPTPRALIQEKKVSLLSSWPHYSSQNLQDYKGSTGSGNCKGCEANGHSKKHTWLTPFHCMLLEHIVNTHSHCLYSELPHIYFQCSKLIVGH